MDNRFTLLARKASDALGSSYAFVVTTLVILGWVVGGLLRGFTDTYHIYINTVSTLATSLSVVLIQNAQNTDTKALHQKIDELVRAMPGADNDLVKIQDKPKEEAEQIKQRHELIADEELS